MTDEEAWHQFPQHRNWFNKLELSLKLGHDCGPCGTTPEKYGKYIVRPIYNLAGMSAKARVDILANYDYAKIEPGHFWCEYIEGKQYSIDYEWKDGKWQVYSAYQAHRKRENPLFQFDKWTRVSIEKELPSWFDCLSDVEKINVEFIENRIIEVHLRTSPDPYYDEIIPIWENQIVDKSEFFDYDWIQDEDNADDHLPIKRLGFFVKGKR